MDDFHSIPSKTAPLKNSETKYYDIEDEVTTNLMERINSDSYRSSQRSNRIQSPTTMNTLNQNLRADK